MNARCPSAPWSLAGLAAAALLALWFDPSAAQTPRYVDNLKNCNGFAPCYATIQAAVDAADPGDTLGIFPGIYHESVNVDVAIRLQPNASGQPPVIRSPTGAPAMTIYASGVRVVNLMLEADAPVIVDNAASDTFVQGNIVRAITPGYAAIVVASANALVKANNVVGGGIFIGATTGGMIANNDVTHAQVDGISLGNTQNTIVQANTVTTAARFGILLVGSVVGNTVQDNVVTSNGSDGIFTSGDGADFGASLFRRNTAVDNGRCDIYDTYTSPSTVTPDVWQSNRFFIGCGAATK